MRTDVVFAGLGGQGLMTMGQILATAAMHEGKMSSYLPSYSPEVRGGWANCTVVVSDRSIGSPIVGEPSALVAMEASSLRKHLPAVRPGGLILFNSSLASNPVERDDVHVISIPANEIAGHLGDERVANIIMLGAYVTAAGTVSMDSLQAAVREQLKKRPELVEVNMKALAEGAGLASTSGPKDA
jgi:2-oxoglutarate ferredoxin oxidoreductase subunit gamma